MFIRLGELQYPEAGGQELVTKFIDPESSSTAHPGYILLALAAPNEYGNAVVLEWLGVYALMKLGARKGACSYVGLPCL